MSGLAIISLIGAYFGVLMLIAKLTSPKDDNEAFFKANQQAPWYVVAFGMVGVSLSGFTFLSVPGTVETGAFHYLQMVLGHMVGYWIILLILLPLYYRMNLTSIYAYLEERFGPKTRKTGATFFLLSRVIGASLRLYLVAFVLQQVLCKPYGIPFPATIAVTVFLVWIYTRKGGLKTVIWTDTLQTLFMFAALFAFIFWLSSQFGGITESWQLLESKELSNIFSHGNWLSTNNFWRSFINGIFITLVMNGLDQDMMQKSLSCRTLRDSQKNIFCLSLIFLFICGCFLFLGGLLTIYAQSNGIDAHADKLFTAVAQQAPTSLFVLFLLGMIGAAYSSADSALTSLTTSFCVDLLNIDNQPEDKQLLWRKNVHILFSLILFSVILLFASINQDGKDTAMWALYKAVGYTYGPLLGLYAFGLFNKRKINDGLATGIAIICPFISYGLNFHSENIFGFKLGFEILLINGALTFLLIYTMSFLRGRAEELKNSQVSG